MLLKLKSSLRSKTLCRNRCLACKVAGSRAAMGSVQLLTLMVYSCLKHCCLAASCLPKTNPDSDALPEASSRATLLLKECVGYFQWVCCRNCFTWVPLREVQIQLGADAAGANFPIYSCYFVCFHNTVFNGIVGLFLAGGENNSMQNVILGCLILFVCRKMHICLSPKWVGHKQCKVALLTLSKAAFSLSSACPNFPSPGDLSQGNAPCYFLFLFFLACSL